MCSKELAVFFCRGSATHRGGHYTVIGNRRNSSARQPDIELLKLQVFAKHSIHAARSDYEGPTAAGGDVDLSDFAIDGDLTSGKRIVFQKGQVQGLMTSPDTRAVQVFSSGSGAVRQDAMELASGQAGPVRRQTFGPPSNISIRIRHGYHRRSGVQGLRQEDVEVVDLNGDQLAAAGNGETRLALSGGRDGLLLVRVHGRSVHLRHVGFSVEGGLDPSRIVFFFPEASDWKFLHPVALAAVMERPGTFQAPS